jgi:phospholipid N-methyltransferase
MFDEGGGLVAEQHDIVVGGRVLIGGEWVTVLRVNRKDGAIVSVTTSTRYCPVRGIVEVGGYEAPSEEAAAKVAQAMKKPPLCNYPRPDFATCTQAEWDAIPNDYKTTVGRIAETETAGAHRVRKAIGFKIHFSTPLDDSDSTAQHNRRYFYHFVYITDAKRKDPPAKETAPPPVDPALFAPVADLDALTRRAEASKQRQDEREREEQAGTEFQALAQQLKTGVQVVTVPQLFPTPPELARKMVEAADIDPHHRILEPSAGTGNLIRAIADSLTGFDCVKQITAVEINRDLCAHLREMRNKTLYANGTNFQIANADFLALAGPEALAGMGEEVLPLGLFDRIIMNPPFQNGADIKHIQHALKFLKPGGRLVALCANGPRQQLALKHITNYGGSWEYLPAGTFSEQGTQVNVALLVI